MTQYILRAAGATRQGSRTSNEDRFAVDEERQLVLVVDGMGGGGRGEQAAELAVTKLLHGLCGCFDNYQQPEPAIQQALTEANRAVVLLSKQGGSRHRCGAAFALAFRHGPQVFVTWLGDCRAYLVAGDALRRLTQDHDVRSALVRNGTMTEEQANQAWVHNVLCRYLGCEDLEPPFDFLAFQPQPGARLILATDGLWATLEPDLAALCQCNLPARECADLLAEEALRRGSRDNLTCMVADFDPVTVDARFLAWNARTVSRLAQAIREEAALDLLPILADSLEDAGCTDRAILDHLRSPGPHVRQCWALDLLLGKR